MLLCLTRTGGGYRTEPTSLYKVPDNRRLQVLQASSQELSDLLVWCLLLSARGPDTYLENQSVYVRTINESGLEDARQVSATRQ